LFCFTFAADSTTESAVLFILKKHDNMKLNIVLAATAIGLIITGYVLMHSEIYDAQKIQVAPIFCMMGFLLMVPAILYVAKKSEK